MARDEKFLSRWSRLKQAERKGEVTPAPKTDLPERAPAETKSEDAPTLPTIESLTKESDFSVFMKTGVPDALRNQALRKLWEADPSLYAHDGLTDYGADYAKIMKDGESRAETAYKVGRGFLEKGELPWEKEEEEEKAKAAAAQAQAQTAPQAAPQALPPASEVEPPVATDRPADKIEIAESEDAQNPGNQAKRTEKLG